MVVTSLVTETPPAPELVTADKSEINPREYPAPGKPGLVMRGKQWFLARKSELAKFGSVGALAFVVDLGVFNLLLIGLHWSPTISTVISVTVATLFSWVANRYWTFSDRKTAARGRELVGFIAVNAIGMAIGVACVFVSHYLLGFTSPLADNIAKNVVGLGIGMVFRYFSYRRWVFVGNDR